MSFTPPNIPHTLRQRKQWLVWRLVQKPDEPKPRKVPFYVNGAPRNGEQGTAEDTAQLAGYDDAVAAVHSRGYTGLGFAPVTGGGIVALDFDSCVKDGQITDSRIEALIADTYAEFSPSGTGLRAFYSGDLPSKKDNAHKTKRVGGLAGAARLDGKYDIEFFGHNGFVTVTGDATPDTEMWGLHDTVTPVSAGVHELYTQRFGAPGAISRDPFALTVAGEADLSTLGPEKLGWTLDQAREYLFSCSASVSREEWVNALMAVHYEFDGSDDALDLCDEWSATGDTYGGRKDVEGRWDSFGKDRGGAPLTGRWLLAWRRDQVSADNDTRMREAIVEMQKLLKEAEDMVAVQTRVMPDISKILLEFPILEIEAYSLVAARAKEFGLAINKTEFKKLIRVERPPAAASITPLTEFGNTERMLAKYGESLMFCPDTGTWYVWTGAQWRQSLGGSTEVMHYAKETIKDLPKEADQHADPAEFFMFCSLSQRAAMVASMVKLAESDPRVCVPSSELDKHKHYLGVKNGVVDLRTGQLMAPDASLRITLTAGCEYNAGAKCPLFEKVMRDAFFDDMEMVEYVCRMFGYALQGDPKEDIMFIAFGGGSNGKSSVFNAVRKAFGGYARSADSSTFLSDGMGNNAGGPREDLLRLRGARFIYVNEPDEGGELREGAVKAMTGGDAIAARGINAKHSVEIEPTWTVFMPTNHKPIIKGNDNGIWRRMGLIPFTRDFNKDSTIKKDETVRYRVLEELPGILAMLVRAGMKYRQSGLTPPDKILAASSEYRKDMDLLAEWLDECCVIDPHVSAKASELWESWEVFARRRGLLNYIRSANALGRRLDARFPSGKNNKGSRIRLGIAIKAMDDVF